MLIIVLLTTMISLAVALTVWCCVILYSFRRDEMKWAAVQSNVPSSVLTSLVIGLAVAVGGYYIQRSQQQIDEQSSKRYEEVYNKVTVLAQIQSNLENYKKTLRGKINNAQGVDVKDSAFRIREDVTSHPLVTGFWQSLSSSGRVKYVDDDKILERISETYDMIQIAAKCEDTLFNLVNSAGFAVNAKMSDGQELPLWYTTAGICGRSYNQALEAVEGALRATNNID